MAPLLAGYQTLANSNWQNAVLRDSADDGWDRIVRRAGPRHLPAGRLQPPPALRGDGRVLDQPLQREPRRHPGRPHDHRRQPRGRSGPRPRPVRRPPPGQRPQPGDAHLPRQRDQRRQQRRGSQRELRPGAARAALDGDHRRRPAVHRGRHAGGGPDPVGLVGEHRRRPAPVPVQERDAPRRAGQHPRRSVRHPRSHRDRRGWRTASRCSTSSPATRPRPATSPTSCAAASSPTPRRRRWSPARPRSTRRTTPPSPPSCATSSTPRRSRPGRATRSGGGSRSSSPMPGPWAAPPQPDPVGELANHLHGYGWGFLERLGQRLWGHRLPDGYPDTAPDWISADGLLRRWETAGALTATWLDGWAFDAHGHPGADRPDGRHVDRRRGPPPARCGHRLPRPRLPRRTRLGRGLGPVDHGQEVRRRVAGPDLPAQRQHHPRPGHHHALEDRGQPHRPAGPRAERRPGAAGARRAVGQGGQHRRPVRERDVPTQPEHVPVPGRDRRLAHGGQPDRLPRPRTGRRAHRARRRGAMGGRVRLHGGLPGRHLPAERPHHPGAGDPDAVPHPRRDTAAADLGRASGLSGPLHRCARRRRRPCPRLARRTGRATTS